LKNVCSERANTETVRSKSTGAGHTGGQALVVTSSRPFPSPSTKPSQTVSPWCESAGIDFHLQSIEQTRPTLSRDHTGYCFIVFTQKTSLLHVPCLSYHLPWNKVREISYPHKEFIVVYLFLLRLSSFSTLTSLNSFREANSRSSGEEVPRFMNQKFRYSVQKIQPSDCGWSQFSSVHIFTCYFL
jgi:hypothetical protein